VGRIFVEEARSALLHIDRALQVGRAARDGDSVLTIGYSPDTDQTRIFWSLLQSIWRTYS
jgi:hypothetical protein